MQSLAVSSGMSPCRVRKWRRSVERAVCSEPGGGGHTLHLLQGAGARAVRLNVQDGYNNRKPLSLFKDEFRRKLLSRSY